MGGEYYVLEGRLPAQGLALVICNALTWVLISVTAAIAVGSSNSDECTATVLSTGSPNPCQGTAVIIIKKILHLCRSFIYDFRKFWLFSSRQQFHDISDVNATCIVEDPSKLNKNLFLLVKVRYAIAEYSKQYASSTRPRTRPHKCTCSKTRYIMDLFFM
ncbi:hypothetical protein J6590_081114 [Homalodisca vitripennis]|nr:hypothetical protein J6590_091481 [Homalodisca vitripennis]KAG8290443.1 hypothetical protein J6590_081114 [Homalodisca vitripennis]